MASPVIRIVKKGDTLRARLALTQGGNALDLTDYDIESVLLGKTFEYAFTIDRAQDALGIVTLYLDTALCEPDISYLWDVRFSRASTSDSFSTPTKEIKILKRIS